MGREDVLMVSYVTPWSVLLLVLAWFDQNRLSLILLMQLSVIPVLALMRDSKVFSCRNIMWTRIYDYFFSGVTRNSFTASVVAFVDLILMLEMCLMVGVVFVKQLITEALTDQKQDGDTWKQHLKCRLC